MTSNRVWSIVLAGGDGRRVRELSRDPSGLPVPKQYWRFNGGPSLLRCTLDRVRPIVPPERTLPVVAAAHVRWWAGELRELPHRNVVVQPTNRGTAAGVLLPLLRLLESDRDALVVLLPSDHFVRDEEILRATLRKAVDEVEHDRDRVVLLGMVPDRNDTEYGWIVPARPPRSGSRAVDEFVEKPDAVESERLRERGAVVNSMILVARGRTLLNLFYLATPRLLLHFAAHLDGEGGDLGGIYEALPVRDFSRDVLAPMAHRLSVLEVPACGWTDVGTPFRVARLLETNATRPGSAPLRLRADPTDPDRRRAMRAAAGHTAEQGRP